MKKCIVILGMHRGGTSALAGSLDCAGITFGPNLHGPNVDNPKGHFEDPNVFIPHDELMGDLNILWFDPGELDFDGPEAIKITDEFVDRMAGYLAKRFTGVDTFGLKDPRMARTLPVWKRVFIELPVQPFYVLILRHPVEVARSLFKRDRLSRKVSDYLWTVTMLDAERHTREERRCFLAYQDLLIDPVGELTKIASAAELSTQFTPPIREEIISFIEPSLNRSQSADRQDYDHNSHPLIDRLYNLLMDRVSSRIDPEAFILEMENLKESIREDTSFHEGLRKSQENVQALSGYIRRLQKQLKSQQDVISNRDKHILNFGEKVTLLENKISEQEHNRAVLENLTQARNNQLSEMEKAIRSRENQISDLEEMVRNRERQISDLEETVSDKKHQISDLEEILRSRECQISDLESIVQHREGLLEETRKNLENMKRPLSVGKK